MYMCIYMQVSKYAYMDTMYIRLLSTCRVSGNCIFLLLVCLLPQVEIESGRLLFRRDLSPAADVGLRQDLLDMLLLNYSHVWLRIGLEVHACTCTCKLSVHAHKMTEALSVSFCMCSNLYCIYCTCACIIHVVIYITIIQYIAR